MRRRRPGAPRRAIVAALGAVVGASGFVAAASPSGAEPARTSTATSGIGATWTTAQGTWAALPMGHLRSASNTFWELLFRPSGASRWTLVTPPGVASNGGLVGAATSGGSGGTSVIVGFQPAKYLRYSPVARTTDGGKKWSTGTLPSGLTQVADALATGSGGQVLALERPKDGTVVRSSGSLTRWAAVTTGRTLAATAAGRACGLGDLSAVATAPGGLVVGGACAKPGVVGLFVDSSGTWQADGPTLPGESGATMRVLRLVSTPAGPVALVEATPQGSTGSGGSDSLIVLWGQSGQAWTASAPVRIRGQVLSAGVGSQQSMTVVTASATGAVEVHTVGGPGAGWSSFGAPRGTQVVAPGPASSVSSAAGDVTALAGSGSEVTVWTRSGGPWRKASRFKVPIEYGSST